jgi:hypothetical protein
MRSIRIAAFAAVAALFAANSAVAADAPTWRDPWASFKPGSSVTMKSTTKMSMAGMPEQPGQESRLTLVSVDDKAYVLRTETKMGETWTAAGEDMSVPRKPPTLEGPDGKLPPVEELGEERVSVEGTDHATKKTRVSQSGSTATSWVSKEHGVLKTETSGPGDAKSTMVVTSLSKKVAIAGREVVCRETKSTSSMAGSETTVVFLSSESIPGGTARMEMNMNNPGMTMTTVTEVTAFEAK